MVLPNRSQTKCWHLSVIQGTDQLIRAENQFPLNRIVFPHSHIFILVLFLLSLILTISKYTLCPLFSLPAHIHSHQASLPGLWMATRASGQVSGPLRKWTQRGRAGELRSAGLKQANSDRGLLNILACLKRLN